MKLEVEDLKRSPDLLYNVKIDQGKLRLIIETYFVLPYVGVAAILVKRPNIIKRILHIKLPSSNSQVISECMRQSRFLPYMGVVAILVT